MSDTSAVRNELEITIVVSGQPERLKANEHQRLEHLVREALARSGNEANLRPNGNSAPRTAATSSAGNQARCARAGPPPPGCSKPSASSTITPPRRRR